MVIANNSGLADIRVDVYWNLHKKCWSIRSRERDDYGKVVTHLNSCVVAAAKFVVNQKGRERVLRERKKNVHAFVRGNLLMTKMPGRIEGYTGWDEVSYNPYKGPKFVAQSTGKALARSHLVLLNTEGKAYYFLGDELADVQLETPNGKAYYFTGKYYKRRGTNATKSEVC